MNRLVIVPDDAFEALKDSLKLRLAGIVRELDAGNLPQVMGGLALRHLTSIANDGELLLWAREGQGHAVAWASGTAGLEGRATADAMEGLIAQVSASHRPAVESAADLQAAEWTNLEQLRGITISEMAACPVILFESCAAVLTRVRYLGETATSELTPPVEAAALLGRLIEDRLIRATLGLESA